MMFDLFGCGVTHDQLRQVTSTIIANHAALVALLAEKGVIGDGDAETLRKLQIKALADVDQAVEKAMQEAKAER